MKKQKSNQTLLYAIICSLVVVLGVMVYLTLSVLKTDSEAARRTNSPATISINQLNPKLGDTVNFTTSGESRSSRITIACYQGGLGNMVFTVDQEAGSNFLLGGSTSTWLSQGGSADCYAWLYNRTLTKGMLAATIFVAEGL